MPKPLSVTFQYGDDAQEIHDLLDRLFSGFLRNAPLPNPAQEQERKENAGLFKTIFPVNVFKDEYAIIYELCVTRDVYTSQWGALEEIIRENADIILNSPRIDTNFKSEYTDSDVFDTFIGFARGTVERIWNLPFNGTAGFVSDSKAWIELYAKKQMRFILNNHGAILNAPEPYIYKMNGRIRNLIGYDDAAEYHDYERNIIDTMRSESARSRVTVFNDEWLNIN